MRFSTVITAGLLTVVGSTLAELGHDFSVAKATAADAAMIERRQTRGGRGGQGDEEETYLDRPKEWDDLPPLEPSIREVYNQHIQFETIAFMSQGAPPDLDAFFRITLVFICNKFTYLS